MPVSTVRKRKIKPVSLNPKQKEFLSHMWDHKYFLLEGAVRSGKTHVAIYAFLRYMRYLSKLPEDHPERQHVRLIVGRTKHTIFRNMVEPMLNEALYPGYSKFIKGPTGKRPGNGVENIFIFGLKVDIMGASDRLSENNIRGATVQVALIDELTVLNHGFFDQLEARCQKMFATTNPDGPAHWVKTGIIDKINDPDEDQDLLGWQLWSFTIFDNPSMDPKEVARLIRKYHGLFYERFILGKWVAAEGAIFDFWNVEDYVVKWEDLPPMVKLFGMGIDYGTTHATSAVVLGMDVKGTLYFVKEWRFESDSKSTRLNDKRLADSVKRFYDQPMLPPQSERGLKPEWIVPDTAGASFVVMLSDIGFKNKLLEADKSPGSVMNRIRLWHSEMSNGNLLVSSECKGLIREMPGYSYDPRASLAGEDKPIKTADDSIDAAGYILARTETAWKAMRKQLQYIYN
jgi:PBSX family phage terminase large subunit